MKKIFSFLIIFFTGLFQQLYAQNFMERTSIGLFAGVLQYHGSMPKTDLRAAAGINLHYDITDKIGVRLQYMASETGGGDSALNNLQNNGNDVRAQHYYFKTNINEISLMPEYNFFSIQDGAKFMPYVFAGIGYYNFKPYQTLAVTNANGPLRYENVAMQKVTNFSNWQMNVPVGIGLKYAFTPNFIVNLEGNYRFLFNKYIDNYIADNKSDSYYSVSLGIIFRLRAIPANTNNNRRSSDKDCNCPPVY